MIPEWPLNDPVGPWVGRRFVRTLAGVLPRVLLPRRRAVLMTVAAMVCALTATGVLAARANANLSKCERFAAASVKRGAMATGNGERVVVIGDSWSAGLGLDHPVQSWPSRLPGRVHVAGFSGTGFSEHASECGRVSFADRAPAALKGGADLVVVEGGLNDYDSSRAEIKAGFARVMRAAAPYRTVVVGPALAPARATKMPRVDRLLGHLSEKYGVPYVSTVDLDLPYLDDRLHMTPAGHRIFGDAVAARIALVSAAPA
jgi:acyl-CoA thioesterase-1